MNQQQRAVVQQALEAMKGIRELHRGQGGLTLSEINRIHKNHHKSIDELTQLLEQPEPVQEPVAWFIQYSDSHEFLWQEPKAGEINGALEIAPLYTTPPAQPAAWVGLTEEEILAELPVTTSRPATSFARAVEAKLKEKNT